MKKFEISTTVQQNPAHTWEYYFNQISNWWPKECYSSTRTRRFQIDTFIGGKVYEDFGEGDGLVWGTVIGVDYLKSLEIHGTLTRAFGGPAITFEKFELKRNNGSTILTYTCDFVGEIKQSSVDSLKKGWDDLLNNHFKNYCKDRD